MKNNHSAPKGKEKSDKPGNFAKGGTKKMFGKMGAAPDTAGTASSPGAPAFSKAPAKGGRGGVMGKQRGAAPAESGKFSSGGRSGDNSFKVSGGSGKMFGKGSANPAKSA